VIGYVTIGTNDFAAAQAFYDALLGADRRNKRVLEVR